MKEIKSIISAALCGLVIAGGLSGCTTAQTAQVQTVVTDAKSALQVIGAEADAAGPIIAALGTNGVISAGDAAKVAAALSKISAVAKIAASIPIPIPTNAPAAVAPTTTP